MRTEVKNRLTMSKAMVSARMRPRAEGRYAWVWIDPLAGGDFMVSTVEIPCEIIDNDVSFYEPDIERTRVVVATIPEAEAEDVVRGLGVDPEELAPPWHNKFPL